MQEANLNKQPAVSRDIVELKQEVVRLNAGLKRTTEEHDILKKAAVYSRGQCNT